MPTATNAAKARALIAWFADLREATDLLAASLRTPLSRLSLTLMAAQATAAGMKAAGMLAPFPRISHAVDLSSLWVGTGATVIAFFTQRKGEATALLAAKRRESGNFPATGATPTIEHKDTP